MPQSAANRWVLLIHQIPPKPDYFRVKVWRRLQRLGAVAIKNSVSSERGRTYTEFLMATAPRRCNLRHTFTRK